MERCSLPRVWQPLMLFWISPFIDSVSSGQCSADVRMLTFRDPSNFVAGGLHHNLAAWSTLASSLPPDQSVEILDWIDNKVDVFRYFSHFKGGFKGEWYDASTPPHQIFTIIPRVSLLRSSSRIPSSSVLRLEPFPFGAKWDRYNPRTSSCH